MKNENFPEASYLHAEDLLRDGKWTEATVTIESVLPPHTVKSADGKLIPKPIVCFAKTDKRLVLGAINTRLMKCAIGTAKVDDWIGKPVTLYAACGNWFGQNNVAAIRVRVSEERAKPFLKPAQLGKDLTGK